jgi:D-alanyl-D-alanine endopeptidase (penicillin-binding protein 7)
MYKLALGAVVSLIIGVLSASSSHAQEAGLNATSKKTSFKPKPRRKEISPLIVSDAGDKLVKRVTMVRGKRKVSYQRVSLASRVPNGPPTMGELAGLNMVHDPLDLKSNVAYVLDQNSSEVLFEKNGGVALPIASITKLMTGLIVVESKLDMNEILTVTDDDVDLLKHSSSRLKVGASLTRGQMLHIALMSSENRAASALGRHYPGGLPAFVEAMNAKAMELGMTDTQYVDSSGLSSRNVSTGRDLAKLVAVAYQQPLLRQYSTDPKSVVASATGRPMHFSNTNHFVANPAWDIGLQKTGFINEAGRCMVMQAMIQGRAVIMVFLDAKGKQGRTSDVGRMRKWLETISPIGGVSPTSTM